MAHAALRKVAHHKNKAHDERKGSPHLAIGQRNERRNRKGEVNAHNKCNIGK